MVIWRRRNGARKFPVVADILSLREQLAKDVSIAKDDRELSAWMETALHRELSELSHTECVELSYCMMKDMSLWRDDSATRDKIFRNWFQKIYNKKAV